MKILNFDTSLEKTYITLSNENEIISSEIIENHDEKYHSAFLIPTLAKIIGKYNLQMSDIDFISTNIGPGSFTGIRAGLTVARTLCQQANIKAIGFTSLQILSKINKNSSKTLVALDARKNAMYIAAFDENRNIIKESQSIQIEEVIKYTKNDKFCVICDEKMSEIFNKNGIENINYKLKNYDLGKFLNELTKDFILKNPKYDYNWAKLKPLYIQPPSVTISKTNLGAK